MDYLRTDVAKTALKTLFFVRPSADHARVLARSFDLKIQGSILRLVHEYTQRCSSPVDPSHLADKLSRCQMTPEVHYRHHKLQNAMRASDLPGVNRHVLGLCRAIYDASVWPRPASVSSLRDSEWEKFSIEEAALATLREQNEKEEITAIPCTRIAACIGHIHNAMKMIQLAGSDLSSEFKTHVSNVRLFRARVTQGFSDARIMGAMFIRDCGPHPSPSYYYYEHLIHEMAHMQLNCMFALDSLLISDRSQKLCSPLRADLRPLFGVFHATFVSAKVAHALHALYSTNHSEDLRHSLAQVMNELLLGIDAMSRYEFTPHGNELLSEFRDIAASISSDKMWIRYDPTVCRPHRWHGKQTCATRFAAFISNPSFHKIK
ncbi:HEXXH motif-containing putative peptide modification protein [Trinickia caryophylli]|nr:HEXXH motif-containing putative peptide modification protein [Trinickia caryophylli]WQE10339.1 HEXXH motif-containing putative peptide modification protein [Trinickia caryophylli]